MAGEEHSKDTRTCDDDWSAWIAIALIFLVLFTGCGSSAADTEATASGVASDTAVEDTTTTTHEPATTTAVPTTTEATTTTVVEESESPRSDDPRFELTGDVDLTTAEINDMIAFVETAAGREFLRPPVIEVQTVEDFETGLVPDADVQAAMDEHAETNARFFQALGFTDQGVDEFNDKLSNLGQSAEFISGRYDPFDDVVYLHDGVEVGPEFNAILVHELLHALDGQHVDLAGILEEGQAQLASTVATDEFFSIVAVVEGRATSVQFDWMIANNALSSAQPEIPEIMESVPAAVINDALLPYQLGAQSIMELGGASQTWHLYDTFPSSSEQMLFTDRIGTDPPVEVAAPVVDGEVFFEGINGAEGVVLLGIGDTIQPDPARVFQTLVAAEGWGGDYFVLTGDDTQSCFSGNIVADTPEDLAELEALFTEWADRDIPATRTAAVDAETLTISSCAPFTA